MFHPYLYIYCISFHINIILKSQTMSSPYHPPGHLSTSDRWRPAILGPTWNGWMMDRPLGDVNRAGQRKVCPSIITNRLVPPNYPWHEIQSNGHFSA